MDANPRTEFGCKATEHTIGRSVATITNQSLSTPLLMWSNNSSQCGFQLPGWVAATIFHATGMPTPR